MTETATTFDPADPVTHSRQVVIYPSGLVRPVPSFHIMRPDGWVVAEMPQAILTIGPLEQLDGVWVNVAVIHERVLPSLTLEIAAAASWTSVQDNAPGAVLNDSRMVEMQGRPTYLRGSTLPASNQSPDLAQLHAIFLAPDRSHPTVDLFQVVCTGPAAHIDDLLPSFVEIAGSFTFF
jgi:hypothetical protein